MEKISLKIMNRINILLLIVCSMFTGLNVILANSYMIYADIILAICFATSLLICNVLHKTWMSVCIDIAITMIICYFFAVTGSADGCAVLWLIILPSFYIFTMNFISGAVVCSVMTVGIMIMFWSPLHNMCYDYGNTFFISFPLIFIVSVMIAVIIKHVIISEQSKMSKLLLENIELKNSLQKKVKEQTMEILEKVSETNMMQHSIVLVAANVIESRDEGTGIHIRMSSEYAYMLADELYKKHMYRDIIDEDFLKIFREAASLHDIGKIQVPDAILRKEGKLTDEEFEVMKTHAQAGGNLIMNSMKSFSSTKLVSIGYDVASYHHERWDGCGYPNGRKGEDIPLPARIMSVADVFEALTAKRTYKPAYSVDTAFSIIENESGKQFDPELVNVFIGMRNKICKRYEELKRCDDYNVHKIVHL